MNAKLVSEGVYQQTCGDRIIEFWCEPDGVHCHEVPARGKRFIKHADVVLSYDDALAIGEKQLTMPI